VKSIIERAAQLSNKTISADILESALQRARKDIRETEPPHAATAPVLEKSGMTFSLVPITKKLQKFPFDCGYPYIN
jgi:hypothetical protein